MRHWGGHALIALGIVSLFAGVAAAEPTLEPYGFVRLDAIYDDSRLSHPQFPFWVLSEPDGAENQQEFSMHPRLTRLGTKIHFDPGDDPVTVAGKVEIDFQNGGRESRALIRMRHAYLTASSGAFEVLAGQNWDLVSPLWPAVNNDGMMWHAGNTGDRRPQVRLTASPAAGPAKLRLAVAAGMTGAVDGQDLDDNGRLDGLDAGLPTVQALAEFDHPVVTIGTWGHVGREALDVPIAGEDDFTSVMIGGHAHVRFASQLWFKGEAFFGRNLTDVRGGIGQGVNARGEEIQSGGGWAELGFAPVANYDLSVGSTVEKARKDDVGSGGRELNWSVYLGQHLQPVDNLKIGLEFIYWATKYAVLTDGDALRVNLHAAIGF